MRPRPRSRLAFAVAAALAAGRASAAGPEGVCVAFSGGEHAAVALAAQRALGVPSQRLDVGEAVQRAALGSRCSRIVVAIGSEALRVAAERAPGVPIVHALAPDGRASGRPGVSPEADPGRVLETLRKMAPRARRIGVVFDPGLTGDLVADAQAAARDTGIEIVALPVRTVGEAIRAYHRFESELLVDALWLLPDGTATVQETVYYALELAHWRRMIVIGPSRWYVASGALFALWPTPEASGTAAGELAQQVLRGATPGSVHAREYALYVNERTAAQLGLRLPRDVLDSAREVLP
jgi:putative ABC transport system substrate-binding protein